MHFVSRGGPPVHDSAEWTPKVIGVFYAYNRVKTVDANNMFVRVAVLTVDDRGAVQAHFAVELRERVDAAEADVAVKRL